MRLRFRDLLLLLGSVFAGVLCYGSSIPSSVLPSVTAMLKADFISIDRIETQAMSDNANGRFDIMVVGSGRTPGQGWRVEVLSVDRGSLNRKWDSHISARGIEFENSGPSTIELEQEDSDYELVIEGCAQHECSDGISGFLVFFGKTGQTFKAKLVTKGLDQPITGPPKYDVTFSPNIPKNAKEILKRAICHSDALTNKLGLPFACEGP